MTLTIGYMYPDLLNLYGDNGNVEILEFRARARGLHVVVEHISMGSPASLGDLFETLDIVFMGGGPDSSQHGVYADLIENKGTHLKKFIDRGGVGLFICGAYQLLGHYYKAADGTVLEGLGIFDCYTQHFGNHKSRCIGNVTTTLHPSISTHSIFQKSPLGSSIVGFENHGGRTYISKDALALATTSKGFGNNGEDLTEGIAYKNAYGTYMHGPLLSKNPHFADYLIAVSKKLDDLSELDDNLINKAHFSALDFV